MNKVYANELADVLAKKHKIDRKAAQQFVASLVNVIQAGLDKDRQVKVKGLGTFKVVEVDPRESVNVNTGERLLIEGHSKLVFVPELTMKDLVNRPFSQFETVILNDGVVFDDMQSDTVVENEQDDDAKPQEEQETESPAVEQETEPMADVLPEFLDEEPAPVEAEQEETGGVDETDETEEIETSEDSVEPENIVEPEDTAEPDNTEEPEEQITPMEQLVPETETSQPLPDSEEDVEEEISEDASDEEEELEDNPKRSWSWLWWLLVALLCLAGGFGAGYYIGHGGFTFSSPEPVAQDTIPAKTVVKEKDTANVPASIPEPVVETQDSIQKDSIEAQSDVPEWERYNNMDVRAKNGYYYIMGLDRIEKAREGDNTIKIANRVFGAAELACYIEVFNGIKASTVLEKGTEVKIPIIKTKKSVMKKLKEQNQ